MKQPRQNSVLWAASWIKKENFSWKRFAVPPELKRKKSKGAEIKRVKEVVVPSPWTPVKLPRISVSTTWSLYYKHWLTARMRNSLNLGSKTFLNITDHWMKWVEHCMLWIPQLPCLLVCPPPALPPSLVDIKSIKFSLTPFLCVLVTLNILLVKFSFTSERVGLPTQLSTYFLLYWPATEFVTWSHFRSFMLPNPDNK